MKKFASLLIFVVVIALASYLWQSNKAIAPATPIIEEKINVNVSFIFDEENTVEVPYARNGHPDVEEIYSLFDITEDIAQSQNWEFEWQDYGDLGILINQIGDKTNGDNNSYWQYYVNDIQPQVSVNNYYPKNNEQIEWRFQESEF